MFPHFFHLIRSTLHIIGLLALRVSSTEKLLLMKIECQSKSKEFFTGISTNDLVPSSWNSLSSSLIILFAFNFTFSYCVIQFLTFLHASQNIGVDWTLPSNFKILYAPSLRCNLFVAQDLSTIFLLSSQTFSFDSNTYFFSIFSYSLFLQNG